MVGHQAPLDVDVFNKDIIFPFICPKRDFLRLKLHLMLPFDFKSVLNMGQTSPPGTANE
jgi:hypothetical protein